jgi:hypothetical protein
MCRKQCGISVKNNVKTHIVEKNIESLSNFMSATRVSEH